MGTPLARNKSAGSDPAVMDFLIPPPSADIAAHFLRSLDNSVLDPRPYRHWLLRNILPEKVCVGMLTLPIAPRQLADCHGVRDTDNSIRTFLTPSIQAQFPICAAFAQAMQRPDVAEALGGVLDIPLDGSYLRMEYIQDLDGAWLEPHCDVPAKLFSMVIYLCTGPHAKDWGTDIYDENRRWVGRSSAEINTAVIFVPGRNTWHGFDKRPIAGVRRLLEINYVHPGWRDRGQLCFPDRPVRLRETRASETANLRGE